jgi:hypothetical protein
MTNAETLVAALEALPHGEPWAEPVAAARIAIDTERAAAVALLFPIEIEPTTSTAIAEYTWHIGRLGPVGYGEALAALHDRSVVAHPELARLLRSLEANQDNEAAAAMRAAPNSSLETQHAAGLRAAAEARARYQTAIAKNIAAVEGHDLADAARALLACEATELRLAACRARHEAHAAATMARLSEERRQAAREAHGATVARVRSAEAALADAQQRLTLTAAEYRAAKADALVERLKLSGLRDLRVGRDNPEVYVVAELCASARGMSIAQIDRFTAAIEAT